MAERTAGERRAEFIAQARKAVREGLSQTRFLRQAVSEGYSFRRTDMIADFHSVSGVEKKAGLLRFVRKDYIPSVAVLAEVSWKIAKEFAYTVQVKYRRAPGEPITTRFVNVSTDLPLTPAQIELEAKVSIEEKYPEITTGVEKLTAWSAITKLVE